MLMDRSFFLGGQLRLEEKKKKNGELTTPVFLRPFGFHTHGLSTYYYSDIFSFSSFCFLLYTHPALSSPSLFLSFPS